MHTAVQCFLLIGLAQSIHQFIIIPIYNRDISALAKGVKVKGEKDQSELLRIATVGGAYRRRRSSSSESGDSSDMSDMDAEKLYKLMEPELGHNSFSKWLRQQIVDAASSTTEAPKANGVVAQKAYSQQGAIPQFGVLDNEMKTVFSENASALHVKPYIETSGSNDFIVMQPGATDMFVTVVPNDVYYNIEKKCVNWLDNCNLKGLRQTLLNKITSP